MGAELVIHREFTRGGAQACGLSPALRPYHEAHMPLPTPDTVARAAPRHTNRWPARRARTSSSTPTTPWTGTRGAMRP
jgi:hypothetical protein